MANLHSNKRIIKWPPFWNKVIISNYCNLQSVHFELQTSQVNHACVISLRGLGVITFVFFDCNILLGDFYFPETFFI